LQEMELGTVYRRRLNQAAPDKGGWNAFFFLFDRSIPNTNPYGNMWIRADGLAGFDGWPTSPRIEALRAAWLDAARGASVRTVLSNNLGFGGQNASVVFRAL